MNCAWLCFHFKLDFDMASMIKSAGVFFRISRNEGVAYGVACPRHCTYSEMLRLVFASSSPRSIPTHDGDGFLYDTLDSFTQPMSPICCTCMLRVSVRMLCAHRALRICVCCD